MAFFPAVQELDSLPLWSLAESSDKITRSFVAKNFIAAMAFLNGVAKVAEEQGHHPDMHLTQYRNVEVQLFVYPGCLTRNDILEARLLDQVPVEYSPKWLREHPEAAGATPS
ncbi:unnamed protein product [Discosporangium mesarthrocarpum]